MILHFVCNDCILPTPFAIRYHELLHRSTRLYLHSGYPPSPVSALGRSPPHPTNDTGPGAKPGCILARYFTEDLIRGVTGGVTRGLIARLAGWRTGSAGKILTRIAAVWGIPTPRLGTRLGRCALSSKVLVLKFPGRITAVGTVGVANIWRVWRVCFTGGLGGRGGS